MTLLKRKIQFHKYYEKELLCDLPVPIVLLSKNLYYLSEFDPKSFISLLQKLIFNFKM